MYPFGMLRLREITHVKLVFFRKYILHLGKHVMKSKSTQ